ncbi:hypothetical protein [Nonomuraea sp. GTA35]|uniref:hypothetical protein n=1 Tax=Nonomuraea sp. GTA35 TaxID=1676746 RepID=UPI0035C22B55
MRVTRFESFLLNLLTSSGNAAIKDVQVLSQPEDRALPRGIDVWFVTGARIILQTVGAAPPGGDSSEREERIVEGAPLPSIEEPAFAVADDRIDVKSFEEWLAAKIANSGNAEIEGVRTFTGHSHRFGIDVAFHNGAHTYTYFAYTLRAGQQPGAHPIYGAKDFI